MAVSSITPAFPDIAREPDESAESVGLLITAFTLPGVFLGLEESGDETEALVKTDIIRINDKIPVDYLLTWSDKRFLIYDVTIDGVSIVNKYRKSFSRVIKRTSYEALLEKMRLQRQPIEEDPETEDRSK